MERQCDVEVMKISNGFLVRRGSPRLLDHRLPPEDLYCFQHFSSLMTWLYGHFLDEGEPEVEGTRWISVEECVPETGQRVFAWAESVSAFPFVLDYESDVLITHWMPIPNLPSREHDCGDCVTNIHNVVYKNL